MTATGFCSSLLTTDWERGTLAGNFASTSLAAGWESGTAASGLSFSSLTAEWGGGAVAARPSSAFGFSALGLDMTNSSFGFSRTSTAPEG